jgi:DNA-binding MarR family transcriptional regulator
LNNDYRALSRRPGFLIRRLHQIHLALFVEECGSFNVTPVQYSLMTVLAERPGLEQLDLANEIGVDRSTIGDVLIRMERRGLVRRRVSAGDRRAKLVQLTAKGAKIHRAMARAVQRTHDRTLDALPTRNRKDFLRDLARLVEINNHIGRARMRLR